MKEKLDFFFLVAQTPAIIICDLSTQQGNWIRLPFDMDSMLLEILKDGSVAHFSFTMLLVLTERDKKTIRILLGKKPRAQQFSQKNESVLRLQVALMLALSSLQNKHIIKPPFDEKKNRKSLSIFGIYRVYRAGAIAENKQCRIATIFCKSYISKATTKSIENGRYDF